MRIFMPVTAVDEVALRRSTAQLLLHGERPAWAVTDRALTSRAGEDVEDLEYDALQDAVYTAFLGLADEPEARAAVMALEVPPHAIEDRPEGGPFGVRVGETLADVHAVHVSELGRAEADASDTDPALLWFDVSEAQAALRYRDRQD